MDSWIRTVLRHIQAHHQQKVMDSLPVQILATSEFYRKFILISFILEPEVLDMSPFVGIFSIVGLNI